MRITASTFCRQTWQGTKIWLQFSDFYLNKHPGYSQFVNTGNFREFIEPVPVAADKIMTDDGNSKESELEESC